VLRLVVMHDGRQTWYPVTSVRHPRRLSDAAVAEIDRRRRGVELYFRHFKQTFGRRRLRSRMPERVRCKAHWALAAFHALLLHAAATLHRAGHAPERLSVATALRAYRPRAPRCFPDGDVARPSQLARSDGPPWS
jgi:hypothetical protein